MFNDDVRLRDNIRGKLDSAIEVKYNGYIIAAGSMVPEGGNYIVRDKNLEQLVQAISTRTLPNLPEVFVPYLNKESCPIYLESQAINENVQTVELPAELRALLDSLPPYVRKSVENETKILAATQPGNRDNQFNASCFKLGTLFAAEDLPVYVALPFMKFAAERNGLCNEPDFNFDEKFKHCFLSGISKPRMSLADHAQKMMEGVTIVPRQEGTNFQQTVTSDKAIIRRVSDVACEPIEWFWPSRIARGKVTLIAGDPGLGKSQLAAFMAGKATKGGEWPNNEGSAPRGSVILLSCEDEISDTIRPRLEAADADVSQVLVLEAIELSTGARRGFSLTEDVAKLEKALQELGDVVLVVIDPITAYMGKTDSHKTGDVRAALAPLQELASRYNVAVVAISHLNKNSGNGKSVNAITGSNAFVAASRATFLVTKDNDIPDKRYLLETKNNLAKTNGLSFSVQTKMLSNDIQAPYIIFSDEVVSITADQALIQKEATGQRSRLQEAESFLHELVKDGPVLTTEIMERAAEEGIATKTLRRAKENLHLRVIKDGFQAPSKWGYPFVSECPDELIPEDSAKMAISSNDDHSQNMATIESNWPTLAKTDKEDVP